MNKNKEQLLKLYKEFFDKLDFYIEEITIDPKDIHSYTALTSNLDDSNTFLDKDLINLFKKIKGLVLSLEDILQEYHNDKSMTLVELKNRYNKFKYSISWWQKRYDEWLERNNLPHKNFWYKDKEGSFTEKALEMFEDYEDGVKVKYIIEDYGITAKNFYNQLKKYKENKK